jgi:hypothetical protein
MAAGSPRDAIVFNSHPQLCTGFLRESARILLTPRKQRFILRLRLNRKQRLNGSSQMSRLLNSIRDPE